MAIWKEIERDEFDRLRNADLYIADCGGELAYGKGTFTEFTPYHYTQNDQFPDLRVERTVNTTRYFKFID